MFSFSPIFQYLYSQPTVTDTNTLVTANLLQTEYFSNLYNHPKKIDINLILVDS